MDNQETKDGIELSNLWSTVAGLKQQFEAIDAEYKLIMEQRKTILDKLKHAQAMFDTHVTTVKHDFPRASRWGD